jgi:hypothetical protein
VGWKVKKRLGRWCKTDAAQGLAKNNLSKSTGHIDKGKPCTPFGLT